MMSAAFERFRFSFFEDPNSARDGLDLVPLIQLVDDQRDRAEDMLLGYLPDTRAVIGLGVLRSRRAEAKLVRLFEAEEPAAEFSSALVYLAKALWRIRRDRRWLAAIVDVLAHGDMWTQRMSAALALLDVDDPGAVPPLLKAIDDPDAQVRHHAARALLAIHGLAAGANDAEHMIYRLMSDDPARRESGKRDVLAAIAKQPIAAHRREQP